MGRSRHHRIGYIPETHKHAPDTLQRRRIRDELSVLTYLSIPILDKWPACAGEIPFSFAACNARRSNQIHDNMSE